MPIFGSQRPTPLAFPIVRYRLLLRTVLPFMAVAALCIGSLAKSPATADEKGIDRVIPRKNVTPAPKVKKAIPVKRARPQARARTCPRGVPKSLAYYDKCVLGVPWKATPAQTLRIMGRPNYNYLRATGSSAKCLGYGKRQSNFIARFCFGKGLFVYFSLVATGFRFTRRIKMGSSRKSIQRLRHSGFFEETDGMDAPCPGV